MEEMKGDEMNEQKKPFDLLNSALNNTVIIGMKGGIQMRGVMVAYDIHMNLVLEKAELLVDGEVKKGLGNVLVRGDSVVYISPS